MTTHQDAIEKLISELKMLKTIGDTISFNRDFTINDIYFNMASELIEFAVKIDIITVEMANEFKTQYTN